MRFVADGLSDIGRVREENQDAFLIREEMGLFAVADGMGRMLKGSLASKFATDGLQRLLIDRRIPEEANEEKTSTQIKKALSELSDLLRSKLGEDTGSTLVIALIKGEHIYIAHLGDSRAYLLRDGRLERLTKDHNMASVLLDAGEITFEEAWRHPARNIVTEYLGTEHALPEVKVIGPETGDRLLLCTDGLSSMLHDEEIARILMESNRRTRALGKLIERANEAGGEDNITAVIIDCVDK